MLKISSQNFSRSDLPDLSKEISIFFLRVEDLFKEIRFKVSGRKLAKFRIKRIFNLLKKMYALEFRNSKRPRVECFSFIHF